MASITQTRCSIPSTSSFPPLLKEPLGRLERREVGIVQPSSKSSIRQFPKPPSETQSIEEATTISLPPRASILRKDDSFSLPADSDSVSSEESFEFSPRKFIDDPNELLIYDELHSLWQGLQSCRRNTVFLIMTLDPKAKTIETGDFLEEIHRILTSFNEYNQRFVAIRTQLLATAKRTDPNLPFMSGLTEEEYRHCKAMAVGIVPLLQTLEKEVREAQRNPLRKLAWDQRFKEELMILLASCSE